MDEVWPMVSQIPTPARCLERRRHLYLEVTSPTTLARLLLRSQARCKVVSIPPTPLRG